MNLSEQIEYATALLKDRERNLMGASKLQGFLLARLRTTEVVTPVTPPVITSFTVNPTSTGPNTNVTLAWNVTGNPTALTINQGVGSVLGSTSKTVAVGATTAYTLTATNSAGTVTATVTATVVVAGAPVISSFTASPTTISPNGNVSLSWTVTGNPTALNISPSVGSVLGLTSKTVTVGTSNVTYTLTATNAGGTVTKNATVTVVPLTSGALYKADIKDFNVRYTTTEQRAWCKAFIDQWKDSIAGGNPTIADYGSPGYPNEIDMYSMRLPKVFVNFCRYWLAHKPDPEIVDIIYEVVKPIHGKLRKGSGQHLQWPSTTLPGAHSGSTVTDQYTKSKSWPGDKTSASGAWRRWNMWTSDTGSGSSAAAVEKAGTYMGRMSYAARRGKGEHSDLLMMVYLAESGEDGNIKGYGTQDQILDNLLGHAWLFWAGYVLDVNRSLKPEYATMADKLYDYAFNNWEVMMQRDGYERHATRGHYDFDKSLYHAVAAHANLYDCFVHWRALGNTEGRTGRPGASRSQDVNALKYLMKYIIDNYSHHDLPSGLGVGSGLKFAAPEHHNTEYLSGVEGKGPDHDSADTTYDQEAGGELMNLRMTGAEDINGRKLDDNFFAALSHTWGFAVEAPQVTGTSFNPRIAKIIANSSNGGAGNKFNFNRKNSAGDWITGTTANNHGGTGGPALNETDAGDNTRTLQGGWYHWADRSTGYAATKNWLRRCKNMDKNRVNPKTIRDNPNDVSRKNWHSMVAFIVSSFERPDKALSDLDTSW